MLVQRIYEDWQVQIYVASQGEQMLQSTSKAPSVQNGSLLEKMGFVLFQHSPV